MIGESIHTKSSADTPEKEHHQNFEREVEGFDQNSPAETLQKHMKDTLQTDRHASTDENLLEPDRTGSESPILSRS